MLGGVRYFKRRQASAEPSLRLTAKKGLAQLAATHVINKGNAVAYDIKSFPGLSSSFCITPAFHQLYPTINCCCRFLRASLLAIYYNPSDLNEDVQPDAAESMEK